MSQNDQMRWEASQLNETINFDYEAVEIDLAPFQLVEKTPITIVHRIFTVLSLRRAYVTKLGRLIGVVGLAELRRAIESANNGDAIAECTDISPSSTTVESSTDDENDVIVEGRHESNDIEKAF